MARLCPWASRTIVPALAWLLVGAAHAEQVPGSLEARAQALVREAPRVGMDRALGDARTFVREHPDAPASQRVFVFLGDVEKHRAQLDSAASDYRAARALGGDTTDGRYAALGLGEVYLKQGRYHAAKALFRPLAESPDHALANVAAQRLRQAEERFREWLLALAAIGLVLASLSVDAAALRRVRARFVVVPEVKFAAPLALALVALSAFANRRLAPGFALTALVALLLAALGIPAFAASGGKRALVVAMLLVLGCAGALYLFAWGEGLIPIIRETILHGPDR